MSERYFVGAFAPPELFEALDSKKINTTEFALWLTINTFQKNSRECFMGNEELARRIGVSVPHLKRFLKHLTDAGFLRRYFRDDARILRCCKPEELIPEQDERQITGDPVDHGRSTPRITGDPISNTKLKNTNVPTDAIASGGRISDASRGSGNSEEGEMPIRRKRRKEQQLEPKYLRLAERLAKAYSESAKRKIETPSKIQNWAFEIQELQDKSGIDYPRIKKAMRWYCAAMPKYIKKPYFPQAFAGGSFFEKFDKIESAMESPKFNENQEQSPSNDSEPAVSGRIVGEMSEKAYQKWIEEHE